MEGKEEEKDKEFKVEREKYRVARLAQTGYKQT
jgi:hypothetical protein